MHDIPLPWEGISEPEHRHAEAAQLSARAAALNDCPDWQMVREYVDANIATLTKSLIASESGGERNRGALEALHHLKDMPNRLIEAAQSELQTHRGS